MAKLKKEELYVRIVDEPIDAWRLVKAIKITDDTYVIDESYDINVEELEFDKGDIVISRDIIGDKGVFRAAIGKRKYYYITIDGHLRWKRE